MMDDNYAADTISLHTLADNSFEESGQSAHSRDDHVQNIGEDSDAKKLTRIGSELFEWPEVPESFSRLVVKLRAPQVFNWGPPNAKWRSTYAQSFRPWGLVLGLWIAIACHWMVATRFARDRSITYHQWAPASISAIFATLSSYAVVDEIRMLSYQVSVPRRMHSSFKYTVYAYWMITVCVIAPLMSIPILERHIIVESEHKDPTSYMLKSWHEALPNTRGHLPALTEQYTDASAGGDWSIRSPDMWSVGQNNIRKGFPDFVTFTLARGGKGDRETDWNFDKQGVFLPVIPVLDGPSEDVPFSTKWRVRSQVLTFGLECEHISIHEQPQLSEHNGTRYIPVKVVDSNGCSATIELHEQVLGDKIDGPLQRLLTRVEQNLYDILRGLQPPSPRYDQVIGLLGLIRQHRKLLASGTPLSSYDPGWIAAADNDNLGGPCGRKILIAAATQPLFSLGDLPEESEIQAASCTTRYSIAGIYVDLFKVRQFPFHDHDDLSPNRVGVDIDTAVPLYYINPPMDYSKFGKNLEYHGDVLKPKVWQTVDPALAEELDGLLTRKNLSIPATHPRWPLIQLREQIGDRDWGRPVPVGSLHMVSKLLISSLVANLASAAGLKVQELLSEGPEPWKNPGLSRSKVDFTTRFTTKRLNRTILQLRRPFKVWILFSASLSTLLMAALGLLRRCDPDLKQPVWDISSIAAKVALLRHSKLTKRLCSEIQGKNRLTGARGLKIGYWSVHKDHGHSGWRIDAVDTLSNEEEDGAHSMIWKQEDVRSAPKFQTWPAALILGGLLLVSLILNWPAVYAESLKLGIAAFKSPVDQDLLMIPLLEGVDKIGSHSFLGPFLRFTLFPAWIACFFAFLWWPALYEFYRSRQPWVGLKTPQIARYNLTLDYYQTYFPLAKAIINRHWAVAVLAGGAFINILMPNQLANLYQEKWGSSPKDNITMERLSDWNDYAPISQANRPIFDHAMKGMLEAISSATQLPDWSSNSMALLPVEMPQEYRKARGSWEYPTSMRRGELNCEEARLDLTTVPQRSRTDDQSLRITNLSISTINQTDFIKSQIAQPCSSATGAAATMDLPANGLLVAKFVCSRWWIQESLSANDNTPVLHWFIATLMGPAIRSPNNADALFTSTPSSMGLICRPVLLGGTGTAQLYAREDAPTLGPIRYTPDGTRFMDELLAINISRSLSEAMSTLDSANGGILSQSPLISTEAFTGDILSYAWYRWDYLRDGSTLTAAKLMQGANTLYSTYFAILAQQSSDLLKTRTSAIVELQRLEWEGRLAVNLTAAYVLLAFAALYTGVLITLGVPGKKYLLPLSPEPLANCLALLCHSSIVRMVERRVSDFEALTLREFYRIVEGWGYKYKLGMIDVAGEAKFVVDVTAVLEDDAEQDLAHQSYQDGQNSPSEHSEDRFEGPQSSPGEEDDQDSLLGSFDYSEPASLERDAGLDASMQGPGQEDSSSQLAQSQACRPSQVTREGSPPEEPQVDGASVSGSSDSSGDSLLR